MEILLTGVGAALLSENYSWLASGTLLADIPNFDGVQNAGDVFDRLLSPNPDPDTIPKALQTLWVIAMKGNMYRLVCLLGLFIGVVGVGFWCVKFYKTLEEGGIRPAMNDLILPLLLVILLSNGGEKLRDLTIYTRDMMSNINYNMNKVVDNEVSLQSAIRMISSADTVIAMVDNLYNECKKEVDISKFNTCVQKRQQDANSMIDVFGGKWPTGKMQEGNGAKWQEYKRKWIAFEKNYASNRFKVKDLVTAQSGTTDTLDISSVSLYDDQSTDQLRRVILSLRGAFLYMVEVMMLVTGLIGPVFVALSIFPFGHKPFLSWGISFLSLGFCKICFTLISGLSAIAMVYSGPDNVDMLVAAIVLGLLAPVLSFSIASGSGFSALSTISYSAQGFKINTGISSYNPSTGQGNPTVAPNSQPVVSGK
jgi:hypothetical protein